MKIILGNLKMNFLYKDFCTYIEKLTNKFDLETPKVMLGIAVPYIYLEKASQSLGQKIKIIAQDIHHDNFGAYTSSVSAPQLSSMNISWSLIGHSECRQLNQSKDTISKKVQISLLNKINVIYCCGKSPIEEIEDELTYISVEYLSNLMIAYEPLEAIGSGSAMNPDLANKKLALIRQKINEIWGEKSSQVKLLYGGSVNKDNYQKYLEKNDIDGVLVGGAALNVDQLWEMATLK